MPAYIPTTAQEQREMLRGAGVQSLEALFDAIPPKARLKQPPDIGNAMTEMETDAAVCALAGRNRPASSLSCFLGAGVYDHYIPAAVGAIVSRQEFSTAYTPYQPEISQGTLTAIFEFQTMIASLTGLDIANASMYDCATAAAEAARMAAGDTRRKRVLVSCAVHPEVRAVLGTYARFSGLEIIETDFGADGRSAAGFSAKLGKDTAAVIVQNPNFFGVVEDMDACAGAAHEAGALAIAVCDPLSLSLLKPPGQCGFDIAVGECQPLGLPMSFGGPYAGYMAAREKLLRRMPGRIVGQTQDAQGRRAFVLTMQTREQHIRREKATSNICSNQGLCALSATVYMSLMGVAGMREAASLCVRDSAYLRNKLITSGKFEPVFNAPYFREFAVKLKKGDSRAFVDKMRAHGILAGYPLEADYPELSGALLVAVTEKRTRQELDEYVKRAVEAV